jgi:hypothetical protein
MTMDNNIVTFPGFSPKCGTTNLPKKARWQTYVRKGPMHKFLFRSLDLILESDDADLVQDVCLDLDKAEKKLKGIRRRLQGVQEQAADQVQRLTTADTKLTAAIVAALLSGQR